jgi:hypothetical protein
MSATPISTVQTAKLHTSVTCIGQPFGQPAVDPITTSIQQKQKQKKPVKTNCNIKDKERKQQQQMIFFKCLGCCRGRK